MNRGLSAVMAVLVFVLLSSSPVLAGEESGTTMLEDGDVWAVAIDNTAVEELWVEYEVRVLEGPPINVWFTNEDGRKAFFDEDASRFHYYIDGSVEETTYADESFYCDEEGVFYVVIDNDLNVAEGQAVWVEYAVTWEVSEFDSFFLVSLIAIIVVIMVVIVVLVALVTVRRTQLMAEVQRTGEGQADGQEDEDAEEGRPRPPEPYPEWVVSASTGDGVDDDDATGWDPSRDEPGD